MKNSKRTLSGMFTKGLSFIVVMAFALSLLFSWLLQTRRVRENAESLLRINIEDVRQDTIDASDQNLLEVTRMIAAVLGRRRSIPSTAELEALLKVYDVAEINVISTEGIIIASTHASFLNYDMESGSQSAEFMGLLEGGPTFYVQSYQPTSHDSTLSRKYAGVVLAGGGFVQVGYDADRFQRDIDEFIIGVTRNRHVGESGFVIVANESWLIVSDRHQNEGQNLSVTGIWIDRGTMQPEKVYPATVYGEKSWLMYTFSEGYYIISVIPVSELMLSRNTSVLVTAVMYILIFLELSLLTVYLVRRLVVNNIVNVNSALSEITGGNLDVTVDERNSKEFSTLSDHINTTVGTLKKTIAEVSARIDRELEFARVVQLSAMPREFPVREDFEIYAVMDPAREVGGDFYDFFMADDDHLVLVIADVSGKGIPAAMFMMTAKSLIKNLARSGEGPGELLEHVNDQFCEGNEAELFVTVWLAVIEISTGRGTAVNAGHEHPALRRAGGKYELVKYRHSPAAALEEGIRFREHTFEMRPGDSLFVYTDGVMEAHNARNELFGPDRMLEALNREPDAPPGKLLENVRQAADAFAGDTPQFDDITMIGFTYRGPAGEAREEITVEALAENTRGVLAMINRHLEASGCPARTQRQIGIAAEEVFVNIASYAYAPGSGPVTVKVKTEREPRSVEITLIDSGVPYDPLKKTDPDLSLPPEGRPIGGMGIFMIKKSMDEVTYERRDGQNILRILKRF